MASAGSGHLDIRRYVATPPEMRQPQLRENLVCLHLGGAKEVRRWHGGRHDVHTVALGALTIMPAGQANRWLTRGPIDFSHLTLSDALIDEIALQEFDVDPDRFHFLDLVGVQDDHLASLFRSLLDAVERRATHGRLYPESLLAVMVAHLIQRHSTVAAAGRSTRPATGGLAPWRLQRVIDYMQAHLAEDIGLPELTAMSGLSRAQFFRAFKQSTGVTPHHYLTDIRLDTARRLLAHPTLTPQEIAQAVGVSSQARLSTLFSRRFGQTPRAFRSGR